MSSDPGAHVKKHTIDSDQQNSLGAETFVHEESGSNRMGIAVRFTLGHTGDIFYIHVGMRIPGSSSVAGADDNFDDHFHFSQSIGGVHSGANTTFATGTNQHAISVGPWWATPGEWLVKYTWGTNTDDNAAVIAIHSWTLPGGSY